MKKREEIERKKDDMERQIHGTIIMPEARRDMALFKHGVYEALAWVLEVWEEA